MLYPALLRSSLSFDELLLLGGVGIHPRQCKDKIAGLKGEFWNEGGDHIIELGTFVGDVPDVELDVHLSKPQLWVDCPRPRQ